MAISAVPRKNRFDFRALYVDTQLPLIPSHLQELAVLSYASVSKWTVADVVEWIECNNAREAFANWVVLEKINGAQLLTLSKLDLGRVISASLAERRHFYLMIEQLKRACLNPLDDSQWADLSEQNQSLKELVLKCLSTLQNLSVYTPPPASLTP